MNMVARSHIAVVVTWLLGITVCTRSDMECTAEDSSCSLIGIPNPINEDQLELYNGHGTDGGANGPILLALSGVGSYLAHSLGLYRRYI